LKIVFVDDETAVLNAIRRSLRREPYDMTFTTDPHEALRLLGEQQAHVLVSDHLMPEITGIELLSIVARLHPDVFRIVLTGQVDAHLAIRAINAGRVHKFLTKPWDEATLKDVLRTTALELATTQTAKPSVLEAPR
jgi:DNA-binding NtrC family response regulator